MRILAEEVFYTVWQIVGSYHKGRQFTHFTIMRSEFALLGDPMHLNFTDTLSRMPSQMQVVESIAQTVAYPRNRGIFLSEIRISHIKHTPAHHNIVPRHPMEWTLQTTVISHTRITYTTIFFMKCKVV